MKESIQEQLKRLKLAAEHKAENKATPEPDKVTFPLEFELKSGKALFGTIGNILTAKEQLGQPSALQFPPANISGTVLAHSLNCWLSVVTGTWRLYRIIKGIKNPTTQAYFVCHESQKPLELLRYMLKVAPKQVNQTSQKTYDQGVFVVHRYDWSITQETETISRLSDNAWEAFEGPHCFLIDAHDYNTAIEYIEEQSLVHLQPAALSVEAYLQQTHMQLDTFAQGFINYYPDAEYSYARIHFNPASLQANAFVFYSQYSSFKYARLEDLGKLFG